MFSIGQGGFHSPIDVNPRNVCIDTDNSKFLMIPELPARTSVKAETQLTLDQHAWEKPNSSNSDICNNNQRDDYMNIGNQDLRSVSFEECIIDMPSPKEEGKSTVLKYEPSEFKDSEIELMQEAFSALVDDDDDKTKQFFNGDRASHYNEYAEKKSRLKKRNSDFSSREQNYHTVFEKGNGIRNVENGDSIDLHPLLLPQVSLDEEEELDRRTFFDHEELEFQRNENESSMSLISPQACIEPSQWLLQQSWRNNSLKNASRCGSINRVNKGSDRASKETKHKHWSEEEDNILKFAMKKEQMRTTDWISVAFKYFNNKRSATQCRNRWKNYLKPGIVRGNWKKHEDEYIIAMKSEGFKWVDIAKGLHGRTGEHIRERYVNVLDRKLKKTCWTAEEDRILIQYQRILGNKWSKIRKFLPGRSDNSIKNRFNNKRMTDLRRLKREFLSEKGVKRECLNEEAAQRESF